MGITGLIPFLEKASSSVNIKQIEGSSVAVDSYCWLHKGVFACADKLIRGEATNVHIQYCLKYVDMLIRYKIKVIMVFDGRHLPAKAETERRRREARNESKKMAKEYLRMNEIEKAKSYMRRAVDVTHEMALELIKACRERGVDCIVAPYEADAQMAWLNKQGLAEYVITEDSDLTLFGANKILFKLDLAGQALLVDCSKLYLAMGCKPEKYKFDKFRRMCILSGCDYLDSLQGIGLKKACKFLLTTEEEDMTKALKKLPSYLKMQLEVTDEYIDSFLKAEATFKHMFVYNPLVRRMERLHELDEFQTDERYCGNAGTLINSEEQAFQLAIGNLNPFTLQQIDNWHPDRSWSLMNKKHRSIWHTSSHSDPISDSKKQTKQTSGSIIHFKKIEFKNMSEIEIQENISEEKSKLEESEVYTIYKHASPKLETKRKRQYSSSSTEDEENEHMIQSSKKCNHNPFAKVNSSLENMKKSSVCTSDSLLKLLSPKKAIEENFKHQIKCSNKTSVKSRFFEENVKKISKKPFASRDLTSEMFKIEEKTNSYVIQQKDLYFNTTQSLNKETEKEDECTLNIEIPNNENQNDEQESDKIINKDSTEIAATNLKFSRNTRFQKSETSIPFASSEEIILLSDNEDENLQKSLSSLPSSVHKITTVFSQFSQADLPYLPKKSQTNPRKTAKTLGSDPKQSRLSMFGFQKKPTLKKL